MVIFPKKLLRLQLTHNDIHGNPNEEILKILQKQLAEIDLSMVDLIDFESTMHEAKELRYSVPEFKYIQICLLEESNTALTDLIAQLGKSDSERWLIEHPEYDKMKDLLTTAFKAGFKTPGRAFRKFLDIIEANKELIA